MIEVDGYRAFRGTIRVTPDVPGYAPFDLHGDCLYKPETDCWYIRPDRGFSISQPADICQVVAEE